MGRHLTSQEDSEFGREFLKNIIEYIGELFEPEDVFDEKKLRSWLKGHASDYTPEEFFDDRTLEVWARAHDWGPVEA